MARDCDAGLDTHATARRMSPIGTNRADSTRKIGHLRDMNALPNAHARLHSGIRMAMRGFSGVKTTTGLPPSNGRYVGGRWHGGRRSCGSPSAFAPFILVVQ